MLCVLNKNAIFQQGGINGIDTYFILVIFLNQFPIKDSNTILLRYEAVCSSRWQSCFAGTVSDGHKKVSYVSKPGRQHTPVTPAVGTTM